MGADAYGLALVQYDDLFRMEDRADALGDDHDGGIARLGDKRFAERGVRLEVERRKDVVKDIQFRFLTRARAIERRCFCPPEKLVPPCATKELS